MHLVFDNSNLAIISSYDYSFKNDRILGLLIPISSSLCSNADAFSNDSRS